MNGSFRRQRGAILIMTGLLIAVLIAIAALAIDVGRLLLLRTEMQNAADSAALAGAVELDGEAGARTRAITMARDLLIHQATFARDRELLGVALPAPPDASALAFEFYCSIGSPEDNPAVCAGAAHPDDANKLMATGDADAHYLRVTLKPSGGADYYMVDLFFVPALRVMGLDAPLEGGGFATALAGRHMGLCHFAPIFYCAPGGGIGALSPGQQLVSVYQSGTWAPGNFGFLDPSDYQIDPAGGGGAVAVASALACPKSQLCIKGSSISVKTEPGVMANQMLWAMNTRFGFYKQIYPGTPYRHDQVLASPCGLAPVPAPNTLSYPMDDLLVGGSGSRQGDGIWDRDFYYASRHSPSCPTGTGNDGVDPNFGAAPEIFRWDYYKWEVENNWIPVVDYAPYQAFDDNATTYWRSGADNTQSIQYDFGAVASGPAFNIDRLTLRAGTVDELRAPSDFTLTASDTGAFAGEEVTLLNVAGEAKWLPGEQRSYPLAAPDAHRYYRLTLTNKSGKFGQLAEYLLAEVELGGVDALGAPQGDQVPTMTADDAPDGTVYADSQAYCEDPQTDLSAEEGYPCSDDPKGYPCSPGLPYDPSPLDYKRRLLVLPMIDCSLLAGTTTVPALGVGKFFMSEAMTETPNLSLVLEYLGEAVVGDAEADYWVDVRLYE